MPQDLAVNIVEHPASWGLQIGVVGLAVELPLRFPKHFSGKCIQEGTAS